MARAGMDRNGSGRNGRGMNDRGMMSGQEWQGQEWLGQGWPGQEWHGQKWPGFEAQLAKTYVGDECDKTIGWKVFPLPSRIREKKTNTPNFAPEG
ncbi:hypothetical protein CEXT_312711 [Caerostris extrusa]|uniref:Uncharacterized protein n=1 Tax=Caerostris extrusa TaxID=172846 RepID=A0AAV4U8E9_CAEEX|nr:hypothetical protein CEXT_312711 [Caerostris extrusa]